EPVDVTGMQVTDVVKYIRGKKGTTVNLHVKKVDGSTTIIPIVRDIVIIDESYAKSLIIDDPNGAGKIGYIKLPRFYADFNRRGGRSCATDVAKELEKLKSHKVDGVVLDLRNNGGGSLRDVVQMSGLFIEEGPIVQVKARESSADVLEDTDPSVQYDGPLVVMVNSFSASASEILAAALQDYGRAVIVGSNSTFGKGTVQRFFDLDRAIRGNAEVKPLGEVKVTIQKFYRINGGSNQLKGVIPDIVLPDRYHYLKLGEKENEYAMQWSSIEPVDYSQSVTSLDNMDKIKAASQTRVENDPTFGLILESAKRLKEQRDDTDYTLNLKEFQEWE
ncbi:MAG: carboxy terminal-processing peptidase, partial [Bacteroidota bacterium]